LTPKHSVTEETRLVDTAASAGCHIEWWPEQTRTRPYVRKVSYVNHRIRGERVNNTTRGGYDSWSSSSLGFVPPYCLLLQDS
ncbi:hypothetical protein J6590_024981, partial [Homalodisca vitripennis]